MTLGADASVALPGLRAEAESLMLSTCTITRGGAEPVWNDATGDYDTAAGGTVYAGKCKIRFLSSVVRESDAQSQFVTEQEPTLYLPIDGSEAVTIGDTVFVTANPQDTGMVGKSFRVAGVHTQTYATQRRLPLEVVT